MDGLVTATVTIGFAFGMQHALDPDHLVAVSTIVGEEKSIRRSSLIGTFWGMGHTTSLLAVGLIVIFSKQAIPPRIAARMEIPVAIMLVYLGIRTLQRSLKGWSFHVHRHTHDGHEHVHFHAHHPGEMASCPHHHHDPLRFALRPYLVGIVHGMAGSGALMLLVLSTVPTVGAQLFYIGSFGVGSIAGMLAMSAAISIPFAFTAIRFEQVNRYIQAGAGLLSLVFGCFLLWQHGIIG